MQGRCYTFCIRRVMSTNNIEKCGQLSIGGIDIYQFKSTVSLAPVNMWLTIKSNYIINIVYSVNQFC